MTQQGSGYRKLVQRLAWPIRRAVAPASLEQTGATERLGLLVAELQARVGALEARQADVEERLQRTHEGLQESRRLNVRVAELTDVVTELVLPLHDREIDATRLGTLRPDTI